MMPFDKSLDTLAGVDLERLVTEKVKESQHLDYKAKSYDATANGHRDFIKDVTAMANAYGGYLILGIKEDDADIGTPATIEPVRDAASEKERLSRVALATIEPTSWDWTCA
jgi:predicted HTH transcriptional regulator